MDRQKDFKHLGADENRQRLVKKGKVAVNISLGVALIFNFKLLISQTWTSDKWTIIYRIGFACILIFIPIGYYSGDKGIVKFVVGMAPLYLALLPFVLMTPLAYLFNLLFYAKLGNWATPMEFAFFVVGYAVLIWLLFKYGWFKGIKEYKKSLISKPN